VTDLGAAGFRAPYRVRFDESTPAGLARTSTMLRYAQDVAWAHSEALGFDRRWYRERGLTWLVRAAQLEILGAVPLGATVEVATAVVAYGRAWARRRGEFRLDDELIAWVHTDWVLIDDQGRVTRIPEAFGSNFPVAPGAEAAGGDGRLARVALPETPAHAAVRAFEVRPHELDPMDHVNNAVYLDWFEESILAVGGSVDQTPRRYSLEYAAAASGGDAVRTATWGDDDGWAHRLTGASGDLLRARLRGADGGS
jgi:acyl-CoA thioester hydrolase